MVEGPVIEGPGVELSLGFVGPGVELSLGFVWPGVELSPGFVGGVAESSWEAPRADFDDSFRFWRGRVTQVEGRTHASRGCDARR